MEEKSSTVKKAATVVAKEEAQSVGLRYSNDLQAGYGRKKRGGGFVYLDQKGKPIKDKSTLARIDSIVIPPAWQEVWICPYENGHIQATGRDVRGRKQYRYHEKWRAVRDETKFHQMLLFARCLHKIRRRVTNDIKRKDKPLQRVLATIVKLLETTLIRVGNDEYARLNGSYGLTTMRKRHVKIKGSEVSFSFRGKSGKKHQISLEDRQVARIVKKCQELPGQELFSYQDDAGKVHDIGSHEVNDYLKEISGEDFTAKDFRTWAGTVMAALALKEFESVTSETQAKRNIVRAIESVSSLLGNTPSVCRKCYVHPEILNSYLEGNTIETISQRIKPNLPHLRQLRADEAAVFVLLQRRLKQIKKAARQNKRVKASKGK